MRRWVCCGAAFLTPRCGIWQAFDFACFFGCADFF
jgi:hypothetical protein